MVMVSVKFYLGSRCSTAISFRHPSRYRVQKYFARKAEQKFVFHIFIISDNTSTTTGSIIKICTTIAYQHIKYVLLKTTNPGCLKDNIVHSVLAARTQCDSQKKQI